MSRETSHTRFGLLPKEKLAQLLEKGSDLEGIMPFVSLLFPDIGSFVLDGNNLKGMVSRLGTETLQLTQPVELQGNPEDWLDDVSDAIQMTLMKLT